MIFLVLAAAGILCPEAIAQALTGMPWETPICRVINSLKGPVVAALAVGAIAFAGIAMAWSESSMFDFLMKVIMGIGIALLAVNIVNFMGGTQYLCPSSV
ncbi:TrbC/VirB2 family protein [Pelomicrobium methylotrophicum]|uniref:TrbC/VirB2 family protein n=1 Tax=Pelomicrobium methylotrophicum TaxID=2602750 RepID=UPI001969F9B2|nr:TrbC/VirB2 family protein [Pelomicrobium methylotrophicum]